MACDIYGADASILIHSLEMVSKSIYFSWGDHPFNYILLAMVDEIVENIDTENGMWHSDPSFSVIKN